MEVFALGIFYFVSVTIDECNYSNQSLKVYWSSLQRVHISISFMNDSYIFLIVGLDRVLHLKECSGPKTKIAENKIPVLSRLQREYRQENLLRIEIFYIERHGNPGQKKISVGKLLRHDMAMTSYFTPITFFTSSHRVSTKKKTIWEWQFSRTLSFITSIHYFAHIKYNKVIN